jgi:ornithine cyclodeaminase
MALQHIDAAGVDARLGFPALIEALAAAFRGGLHAPTRHHHHIPRADGDATLLLMPAWTDDTGPDGGGAVVGTKIVSVFPGAAKRGLPSVAGLYLLMDGLTGQPLATMDGARLTLWRTAAASALAARHLARADASRLVMVGAGALAPFLIAAHATVRPIKEVALWNHNRARAEALAETLRHAHPALAFSVPSDLEATVRQGDIISCATLSTTALVMGEWLKPGAHLDLVGAFTLGMREADDAALARGRVFVDTPAAFVEGGDVAVAIKGGAYRREQAAGTLADLVSERVTGRDSPEEVTLFKSIGAAIEDLAAARLVWQAG